MPRFVYRFLRDDSRSVFIDEDDDEDEEGNVDGDTAAERKEKARALWKVRQKVKTSLFEEDENSLSRFDIFDDPDKSRGASIRTRIENACRPASTQDVTKRNDAKSKKEKKATGQKRKSAWGVGRDVPEWEKRKACMEQKARKRQRSVSVGNWSFAAHGEKQKAPVKVTKLGSSGNSVSLGATCVTRKVRPHLPVPKRSVSGPGMRKNRPSNNSKGPTSFKGLFSILGATAKSDK